METSQWPIIDATMDNEASVEAGEGDPRNVADLGDSIRQAGWAQIPDWPRDLAGFEHWPAPGQTSTLTLGRAQWELVISALERWSSVTADLGDPEAAHQAEADRALVELIRTQLLEQGWTPR
ncbi:hypothetical protein HCN51_35905 [Nonomuraea sp. FMUSA5-5]|uniref:DUF2742 domain-containing protein n=1 Tax=Nonomuraea composti TaxID=2720023 RepID=A0ABX1BE41_9ACTN|nr:hypothetical protein [Nonomuraea sp. FMUSA5-5]NJP94762.1 hypothetical protein [Nonomuraea sp. FMUSA5-5]